MGVEAKVVGICSGLKGPYPNIPLFSMKNSKQTQMRDNTGYVGSPATIELRPLGEKPAINNSSGE